MRNLLLISLWFIVSQSMKAPIFPDNPMDEQGEIIFREIKDREFRSSEFSPKLFYEALIFVGIQNPEIVFRQTILETGWFKSMSFVKYHNPFGMKQPKIRDTYCVGTELGHGKFNHWYEAIKDYKLWQDYWLKSEKLNKPGYYQFLDKLPYAESKNYTNTLKKIRIDRYLC